MAGQYVRAEISVTMPVCVHSYFLLAAASAMVLEAECSPRCRAMSTTSLHRQKACNSNTVNACAQKA